MKNEPEVRLSVATLRQLIENAESECYVLARDQRGNWIRITPYISKESDR